MEESGISRAVVMGRKADEYGEVDNEDILELARAYPGRVPRRWLAAVLRQPP